MPHVLNLCEILSMPSLHSSATLLALSWTVDPNTYALSCNSPTDFLAFAIVSLQTSEECSSVSAARFFKVEIKDTIFWIIFSITAEDLSLISAAIALSFSTRDSALLTVSSTWVSLPAVTHVTPEEAASWRSSSITTLMPWRSQLSLASSRALACSLALFASSSAQALVIQNYSYSHSVFSQ